MPMGNPQAYLADVARAGRGSDSMLAHVNPFEVAVLKALGGSGTRNPHTGLPEFLNEGLGRDARGRDFSDRDDDRDGGRDGGLSSRNPRDPTGAIGPAGVAVGPEGVAGIASRPGGSRGFGMGDGSSAAPTGNAGAQQEAAPSSFKRAIAAAANVPSPFSAPTGQNMGILGTALTAIPGFGLAMALGRAFQALGATPPGEEFEEGGRLNRGGQQSDRLSAPPKRQTRAAPTETGNRNWQRPGQAPQAPGSLNFDPNMTPLQQRASVATSGTNSQAGAFMDPAVTQFYRNLALFDLLGQNNQLNPGAQPLAVERQYVTQLGGKPGETPEDFIDALMAL